jgi:hypothetical protein
MTVDRNVSYLGLPSNETELNCVAFRWSATAHSRQKCVCLPQNLHEIPSLPPTLIFVHLGENDVLNCDSTNGTQITADLMRRVRFVVEAEYIAISLFLS